MACTLRTPLSRAISLVGRNCLPGKSQLFRLGSLQSNLQLQRLAVNSRKMATAAPSNVIFRQLFDHRTYTYTYLLADKETRDAVLIDPVYELVDRDIRIMGELGVKLRFAVNTHCHADHVTATGELKKRLAECKSGISDDSGAAADWKFKEGDKIEFGGNTLEVRATPGHTDGCVTFVWHEGGMAFTGDALLIRGCGRTDFQQGNSKLLYNSVHNKILSLPDETLLYPAHDYTGQTVSTVAEEKKYNTRLTKKVGEFEEIMENLNLPYPKEIDRALPLNLVCGVFEAE